MRTHYLNTDLDLWSREDLRPLTRALLRAGMFSLHVGMEERHEWRAPLEVNQDLRTPQATMSAMLNAIESLKPAARARWNRCRRRDLNIGYECGDSPHRIEHGVPRRMLERIATLGLSLRVTLYSHLSERPGPTSSSA